VAASEMDQAARVQLTARLSEAQDQADLDYLRERVPQALTRCVDGLGRVAKIVAAMRAFAHSSSDTPSLIDVNEEIRTTVSVAVNEYKYVADVSTTLGQVPLVVGAEGEIAQALLNLIVNAAHAIAEVHAATAERGEIAIATESDERWVTITIADTGGGIPAEIAERVFDPFFTTKEVGRGSGQGLGIARSIVQRHHGTIGFEVRPGEGTTFKIQLPINVGRQDERPR
jgi:two-component system, NtrC family, sensor kinase